MIVSVYSGNDVAVLNMSVDDRLRSACSRSFSSITIDGGVARSTG